jgi:polyphosphate kinase
LEEAESPQNPMLERLKFLSIFCSNLDEFFMVRVGSLFDQVLAGLGSEDKITELSPAQQLDAIFCKTADMVSRYNNAQAQVFSALDHIGVHRIKTGKLSEIRLQAFHEEFNKTIRPLVSIIIVDGSIRFLICRIKRYLLRCA